MALFELDENLSQLPLDQSGLSLVDRSFYTQIWNDRVHQCQCCNLPLYEPLLFMFHHVLEKRLKKHAVHADYSRFRHCRWNIMLLCWECHQTYENQPASKKVTIVADYRHKLLTLIELEYEYDQDHIWLKDEVLDLSPIQQLFAKYPITLAS